MLFNLKALASALLLTATAFGVAVDSGEHLEKRAQPKGIDVSSNQGSINWKTVAAKGVSFAYIKATEGTSKDDYMLVARNADIAFQATRTLPSPPSTPAPPMPVSFAVATTSPSLIGPLALLRPSSLLPTAEAGAVMGSPFRVLSTSNVRVVYLQPSRSTPTEHPPSIGQITHTAAINATA